MPYIGVAVKKGGSEKGWLQNKATEEIGFFSFGLLGMHSTHFIPFVFPDVRPRSAFRQGCITQKSRHPGTLVEILKLNGGEFQLPEGPYW